MYKLQRSGPYQLALQLADRVRPSRILAFDEALEDKDNAQAAAARVSIEHGASWGFMSEVVNQHFPFRFDGPADDPEVYEAIKQLTVRREGE